MSTLKVTLPSIILTVAHMGFIVHTTQVCEGDMEASCMDPLAPKPVTRTAQVLSMQQRHEGWINIRLSLAADVRSLRRWPHGVSQSFVICGRPYDGLGSS